MWRGSDDLGEQKSMTDYIVVCEKLTQDALEVKVVRRMYCWSAVLAMTKIRNGRQYSRSDDNWKVSKVVASEKLDRKEVRKEYERRVCERLNKAGMKVSGDTC